MSTDQPRMKVRKWRKRPHANIWEVFDWDGNPSGDFDSWAEAMQWATSPADRLEYWLEHQR